MLVLLPLTALSGPGPCSPLLGVAIGPNLTYASAILGAAVLELWVSLTVIGGG